MSLHQVNEAQPMWITSFWGFGPEQWGCIGFSDAGKRDYFIRNSRPGALVAVYVTKHRGPDDERGKIIGFLEVSHEGGSLKNFISGDLWAQTKKDPESRGKWSYALKVTRAWRIIREEQPLVDDALPSSYSAGGAIHVGAQGVIITREEAARLHALTVYEVPVYGQRSKISPGIQSLRNGLKPSQAIQPPTEPYWVGETDGPKHLYILRLRGDVAQYLGRSASELEDKEIIKVGFSKSPLARRDQIQAAYPAGMYRWEVFYPQTIPPAAPYPNAQVAIAGEDAMKERLIDDGAESLGGEFFLADTGLVYRTWFAGKLAAEKKSKGMQVQPTA